MTARDRAAIAEARLVTLWATYTAAAVKAQSSGRIDDGIAAGRAWADWLDAAGRVVARTDSRSTSGDAAR